jgi:hypothetical protein
MKPDPYLTLAIAAAAFGIGFFLFGHGLLMVAEGMIFGLWEWLWRTIRPGTHRLRQMARESRSSNIASMARGQNGVSFAIFSILRFPAPTLAGVLMGLWVRDWMLSPLMVLIGAVVSSALFARTRRAVYNKITDELEMLILQFVSRYPLRNSVATALAEAADQLPAGMLREAAANTATRLKLQDSGNPFRDLMTIPHPVARRFAGVLLRAGFASPEVFLDLLSQLRKDTEAKRELQQRVRRDLTLESATITILQVALIISLVAVAVIPSWRVYYLGSIGNRVVYLTLVALGVVGTVIGENEIQFLEEA